MAIILSHQRIKNLRIIKGFSQVKLASLLGVSQAMIARLESGDANSTTYIYQLAQILETSVEYLTGQTDIDRPLLPSAEAISEQLDLVQISMIDLKFGMGGGAVFDAPVEIRKLSVSRAWISLFTNAKPECVFVTEGRGDSNAPTINDGDLVFFDTSQNQPTMSDEFWAMTHYGHGVFKRLRPTQGGYKIMSDNPLISDDIATDGEMAIIGRVIAIMRRM